jgi:hypothetical protein
MENLIHNVNEEKKVEGMPVSKLIISLLITIIVGVGIGFGVYKISGVGKSTATGQSSSKKSAGIANKETFKDKAEGVLKEGGIDGEGNFHLERPGGQSQNVYLTSTTVDLSLFVGKKVRVWGETFSGQQAGWLMDVGYVESL